MIPVPVGLVVAVLVGFEVEGGFALLVGLLLLAGFALGSAEAIAEEVGSADAEAEAEVALLGEAAVSLGGAGGKDAVVVVRTAVLIDSAEVFSARAVSVVLVLASDFFVSLPLPPKASTPPTMPPITTTAATTNSSAFELF